MLVSTSSVLWAPTQELVFGRHHLRRGWTLVRSYAVLRGVWPNSIDAMDYEHQVESDPLETRRHPRSGR